MTANAFGILLLTAAVLFDLGANICLKKSNGFAKKSYGLSALCLVTLSFLCLAHLIRIMDLSIAYALFGVLGLLLMTTIDARFFHLRISPLGICGLATMIAGVVLIKLT